MDNILERIYKTGLRFLVPLTPEETYRIIVDEAVRLVNAEYGSIILEQKGNLERVYASSPVAYKIKTRKHGNTYLAFSQHKVLVVPIYQIAKSHPEIKHMGIKWTIFIPLSYQSKSIGVLTLNSKQEKGLSEQDLKVLQLFGSLASLAIRKTQLYDETIKALETRDLFISMAAHELRTPITTINGYIQLLYSKLSGSNAPESRWVEELSSEASRLTQLVNELLVVNRIKSGALQYVWRECNLREIIHRAILDFRFTHPHHKVILEDRLNSSEEIVVGDFDKLLQVIINLLDNAAKFSPPDSEIVVSLKFKSPYLILHVKDSGKGIAKKDLPKVFEGFYKGRDPSKEGMGLGLFLAKNIIKEHHGSIHIHSKVSKGTLVEVQLPRAKYND